LAWQCQLLVSRRDRKNDCHEAQSSHSLKLGQIEYLKCNVPNPAATMLPAMSQHTMAAMAKWDPNGKEDAKTPAATPAATAFGVALRRRIRFETY